LQSLGCDLTRKKKKGFQRTTKGQFKKGRPKVRIAAYYSETRHHQGSEERKWGKKRYQCEQKLTRAEKKKEKEQQEGCKEKRATHNPQDRHEAKWRQEET